MPPSLSVPYTQQFAPATTPLKQLLGILRQQQGKPKELKEAIGSAFFNDSKTPEKLAGNTLISLKVHGIIGDNAELTEFGKQLVGFRKEEAAKAALAKNILMKLDGLALVDTLREMHTGDIKPTLNAVTDELKKRSIDVSENSSDLSGVLGWLREAGVLDEYKVNEVKLAALVGTTPKTLEAMKNLEPRQVLFLRAMVALAINDWIPHNKVVIHAENLYAGQVKFNWKDLERSIVQPLARAGFIDHRKAPKSTSGSRGGKASEIKPTEKFTKEIAEPVLAPMYKTARLRDIGKVRGTSWAQLVADIKQKTDDDLRGKALEVLAVRISQLLDLEYGGLRETDEDVVGGGEVDAFMYSSRLIYSRWQIQCKASDKIAFETIAKEVGVAEVSLANVIMIVSTGKMTPGAELYRRKIIGTKPLNIVVIDGDALENIVNDPSAIVGILTAQAEDAMKIKPLPQALTRSEGGEGGGAGGAEKPETAAAAPEDTSSSPSADKTDKDEDNTPTLFKPAYATSSGEMYLGDSYDVLRSLIRKGVRVKLIVTSPPFALIRKKDYGNEAQEQYVQWFMRFAPLFREILEPDGSFVMDIGGTWIPGIPARSVYQYRLLLRLCESGFYLAQEFFHYNRARLPTPAEWVTIRRLRVKDAVNNVWWFVRDPFADADNRRVLREYSDAMKSLLKNGYKAARRPSGHDISKQFNVDRGGAIPPNVLELANTESNSYYLRACRANNVQPHPARFPIGLPEFFIRFVTRPGELVLDPFAGSNVTGEAAESLGRRWIGIELNPEYVKGSRFRFDKPRDEVKQPSTGNGKPAERRPSAEEAPLLLVREIEAAERTARESSGIIHA